MTAILNTVCMVAQLILTFVLAGLAIKYARDLEKAKEVGAGLVWYMQEHGLELPPPEEMSQIINEWIRKEKYND